MTAPIQQQLELASAAHQRGDLATAQTLYEAVLKARPGDVDCLHMLGVVAAQTGNFARAADLLGKAIALQPADAALHANLGNVYNATGDLRQAVDSFDRAIALQPDFAQAHSNRGNALVGLQNFGAAVASYDRAIALVPAYADAHFNKGVALQQLGQHEAAVVSFDRVLALNPGMALAHDKRGLALQGLGQQLAALASFDRAISASPGLFDPRMHRADLLHELGRLPEALADYDQAVRIEPQNPIAHDHRAIVLRDMSRHQEAVQGHVRAIELQPDYAAAYNNCGIALAALGRREEAATYLQRAIELRPDFLVSRYNLANVQRELRQLEAALATYEEAYALAPDLDFLQGDLLHTRMHLCIWDGFDEAVQKLESRIAQGANAAAAFVVLSLCDSPPTQLKAARAWSRQSAPATSVLGPLPRRERGGRIRVAYFSPDFHEHPVAHLMAGLFEAHDRQAFELFGFAFGVPKRDPMRNRLASAFEHFIEVHASSDLEVARQARDLKIDIAVDLAGFTQHSRPGIFAARCAPVQASYLGYPGTMGAEYIDYLVADRTVIPDACQLHFSEKIAYLPHSYMVNDDKLMLADHRFSRSELGLPESGFVFCCFNNGFKISPSCFDAWMRILRAVEGSVLWLRHDNPAATSHLKAQAQSRGVQPERLVFAQRMPLIAEHLARHRAADLFLDSWPYNAHTTASDALFAGLPVLTRAGQAFAGRVGASLLTAIGLPELIAGDTSEYESRAISLATQPLQLAELRHKLAAHRHSTPLFNTRLFARNLETAYVKMHERQLGQKPPEHIFVEG